MRNSTVAKPRTVVCHICGREFGSASIDIHVPKCAKKWEEVEAQKPENERRPVPQKPSVEPGLSLEEYNKAAQENFNEQGMMRCPNCGRTFLEDRLEVHLRSCKPKAAGQGAKTGAERSPTPVGGGMSSGDAGEKLLKPRTVVCHICGREFGTASIDIHIAQCAKKWEEVEAQKPETERRPVPQKPSVDPDMSHEEYNKAAQENFNEQGMMRCPNCGRTFLEDRLEVHLRSCKPKDGEQGTKGGVARSPTPVGRVSSSGDSDSKMFKPRTVVCHICGREFGTASIDIHIPQCAKKWKEVEAQKPDHKRRPVPQKPSVDPDMSHEEYNKTAQETFNEQGMMRCPTCGLTFLEDRLEVHLRSCKQKGRARSSGDPALKTQKAEHEQRAVPQKPVMESARNLEEQDKAMGSACKAGSLPPSRPPRSPAIVPQASLPPSARASAPGRHAFSTELSAARRRSSSSSPARRLANARALDGELAAKRHAIATQIAAAEASHAQHLVQMLPDRSPSSSSSSS